MPDDTVTVVANVKAKSGAEDKLREVLVGLIAPTRGEPGCLNFDLHLAIDDASVFVFHENWTSKKHLDDHLASPHVKAFIDVADDLVEAWDSTLMKKIE